MKRGLILLTACWLLASRSFAADGRTMAVYPLFTSDAAATVSAVESVLGPDGKVIYDKANARLLVLATADIQKQVADILKQVNVPPANVRIEVTIADSQSEQLTDIGVKGHAQVGVAEDGTSVAGSVAPHVDHRTSRHRQNVRQTLLVQSGREAELDVGEEVPYADWLVQYGCSQGYLPVAVQLRDVGARLRVQARVIGDGPLISLKFTPEVTGTGDSGPQTIAFTRISTDVTVTDGQTLNVGGLEENRAFYEKFLVGVDRSGRQRALSITVTPHIEPPGDAPPQ